MNPARAQLGLKIRVILLRNEIQKYLRPFMDSSFEYLSFGRNDYITGG